MTLVRRKEGEIRTSLQDLHTNLSDFADVVVRVEGEHGATEEFDCVGALLAASSRPLGAMLFGPLRAATPQSGEERPILRLRLTEPQHFKNLLRFIHGQDIRARPPHPHVPRPTVRERARGLLRRRRAAPTRPAHAFAPLARAALEVEDAFQMHAVADFYEVLGLRDLCTGFLINSLRPHNCCHLLARGQEVHCEALVDRCLDLLTLDFIAVVEHDHDFPSLSASALLLMAARDELVVSEEFEVFEAIAIWYERRPSADKYAALPELLQRVRWALVREERRDDVNAHAARLRPPAEEEVADEQEAAPPPEVEVEEVEEQRRDSGEAPCSRRSGTPVAPVSMPVSMLLSGGLERLTRSGRRARERAAVDESGEETEIAKLLSTLFPREGAEVADPPSLDAPPAASSSTDASPSDAPRPRQTNWGQLIARHPAADAAEKIYVLQSTKEYMVGRSRKSDIRIGHNAQMPYISSQHCRVFHAIHWPDGRGASGGPSSGWPADSDAREPEEGREAEAAAPRLQAWLEDLSQNGTFINGQLVGRNKQQPLAEGDRIEMVFPQGRQPANNNANAFPVFTYVAHRPPEARPATPPSADEDSSPPVAVEENETLVIG